MASPQDLKRLDALIWTLIYAGLFCVVLGLASRSTAATAGWILMVLGAIGAAAGAVLIVVRARLIEDPPASAQSPLEPRRPDA